MTGQAAGLRLVLTAAIVAAALSACGGPAQWEASRTASEDPSAGHGGVLSGGEVSEAQWSQTIADARSATYEVFNTGCEYDATGSAVAVGPKTLVTNRHVVEGARELHVMSDGTRFAVQSWDVSSTDDIAVLHLGSDSADRRLSIASEPVVGGDLVAALGYPLGGPLKAGRGRVVAVDAPGVGSPLLRASMDVLPGNSGGPVVTTGGELVGLIRAIDLIEGWALAVPVDRVARALDGDDLHPGRPCDD